ncbi:carbamoyltransferase C-terminal domain-containing protein, partial [Bacteroidota bacterium]
PVFVHDHNMSFFYKGRLKKHLQLERITRKKYDNSLDSHIYSLLKKEKLINEDYDIVFVDNIIGRAFISFEGEIRFEGPLSSKLSTGLEIGKCWWFGNEKEAYVLNHELAHVYSCLPFFGNFKENSLLIHFDGGASLSNFSAWTYKNNQIEKIEYYWDLKYLSSLYNANALAFSIIGAKEFDQHSVPGKLMGFACYGKYSKELESWLAENDYFQNIWTKKSIFFEKAKKNWNIKLQSFDKHDQFLQNIAATFQHIFQRDFLKKIEELKIETSTDYLYLTGGSALNILANTELLNRSLFKDVFIPPCTNDSGLSIGAGALVEQLKHGKLEKHSPYLNNWGIKNSEVAYNKKDISEIAKHLLKGKVVAICNGFGESGPRALGNRSILALANSKNIAKAVSEEHKKREWYRPVAPVMLEKNAKYFTELSKIHHLSKFMLLDFKIPDNKITEIEGVVHVDKTSRIQTIFNRSENPYLFDLLTEMDERYKIKALINTSFNIKGEPIVHTPEDAIRSARNMKLDGVVINGKLKLF